MNLNDFDSYGRAPGHASGGRGRARTSGQRMVRADSGTRDADRGRRGAQPARAQCPAELREPFTQARDFVAGLISVLGLPARLSYGGVEPARDGRQITIDVRSLPSAGSSSRTYGAVADYSEPDDLGALIGKHGATLDALTAVVNAHMHRGDPEGLFFAVDVEGYRARRAAMLRSIAQRGADRALADGIPVELEPMPPADRRIVHIALAAHRAVATESTGIGLSRRVVIVPRGARPYTADDEGFE